ncbi:hypothetical protein JW766_01235 [Candidatus Dojkabacteria bacterium]|nr:hypothetical protein [Candidatus Dojkabacteria bacterium]
MKRKFIFPLKKNFDYFNIDNFRTKKLEGTVELRNADLPGADAYIISPKLYISLLKEKKFPESLKSELAPVVKKLIKKFSKITVRTCFRFSGYENPRSLPAFRDLKNQKQVLTGIKQAYKAGEDFAKENNIDWFELGLIIMGRVEAEKSGIIIVDPEKSNLCVVEVCWGDVHLIAVGEDDFDSYWVNRKGKIVHKVIREKKKGYYFKNGDKVKRAISKSVRKNPSLTDNEVKRLAENAFKAATYHNTSVEIEYMIRRDGFIDMYELQERSGLNLDVPSKKKFDKSALVNGIVVNKGRVEGIVKIVKELKELKEVQPGAVLVLPSELMGEDIPVIGKIKALITDTGGITAHISTIAKECKIPCIVGTQDASKKLKNGMRVVVDADVGKIYPSGQAITSLGSSSRVLWLEGLKAKLDLVGAKAFNLIGLMQLGENVPAAYVATTEAFSEFLKENRIDKYIEQELVKIDVENLGDSEELLKKKILSGKINNKLKSEILEAFKKLKAEYGKVSVRSSATCEDSVKASFAGQFQSFLFVDDKETLFESVRRCWASLFRAGAVVYAVKHGIDIKKVKMAVIIQGMVDADKAGVIFTKDLEGKKDIMIIEAAKGIGENVVSGEVTPVTYTVSKETGRIMNKEGSSKELLTTSQILNLTNLGKRVEEAFELSCDIEWAIKGKKIYLLQTRPITT